MNGHLSRHIVANMFKRPTRKQAGHFMLSVQSCFEWGLQCPFCYQKGGSLLHCPFTLTGEYPAVCSLLHFPGSHLHRPLAGTLPYDARTFLMACHAIAWPPGQLYKGSTFGKECQGAYSLMASMPKRAA